MSFDAVFHWIYCLDFHDVLILFAIFTGLFYIVRGKYGHCRFWKPALWAVLMGWAYVVISQTLLRRTSDTALEPILQPFQSYVDALKHGGQMELLRSNFMNVVLFYPAGVLAESILPAKWKAAVKVFVVFAGFTLFSTAIEYLQYRYSFGLAQTDDVIHNALGALIGTAVMLILPVVCQKIRCNNSQV